MLVTTGMFASSLLLIPTGNQWHRIRFLRLTRADGRDNYMHVHRLNAYDLSQRHIAITGTVYPQHDNGIYDWDLANNENDSPSENNFAHTDPSKDAIIQLDFGSSGVSCNYFVVVHRGGYDDRMIGTRFEALNIYGRVVLSYEFTDTTFRRALFTFPSNTPEVFVGVSPIDSA